MRIALIGATGAVGSKVLAEALNRGHQVTGIVRHPEKLPAHPRLTAQRGDVFDEDGLAKLLAGHDAVISSLQFTMFDPHSLVRAVKKAKSQRYLVVGGTGSLVTRSGMTVTEDPAFPPSHTHKHHGDPYDEGRAGHAFLKILRTEQELNWTFLSPSGQLTNGARTGKFRLGKDQLLVDANGKEAGISKEDFAIAMIDELETPRHPRQRFTVGY
jgi:hypothetical protein